MQINFWSNTECSTFMVSQIQHLREAGWNAVQRYQVSQKAYRNASTHFSRLWLRVRMYLVYPLQICLHFITQLEPGISIVTTNTFFAPLLAVLLSKKNQKIIHLVYDLYPDVLITAGILSEKSLIAKILHRMTLLTFRRCTANVFLGRHLLEYAERNYGTIPNAVIISVGSDGHPFRNGHINKLQAIPQIEPIIQSDESKITVLYCGNFGRLHDYKTLAAALLNTTSKKANAPQKQNMHSGNFQGIFSFKFCANGLGLLKLKAALKIAPDCFIVNLNNGIIIKFYGNLSEKDWVEEMKSADIALVTMAPGAEKVIMPSKAYSAMVAGQAILAVCAINSDLGDTIRKHDCGWVVEPGDEPGFQEVLKVILTMPDVVSRKRLNSYVAGHCFYDSAVIARQWIWLFNSLDRET